MIKILDEKTRYIGVDDFQVDLFEGQYIVPEGISYNSYLILDEKVAIVDTVDGRMAQEWLPQLSQALEGRAPDYLIVHHMEPDHSSLVAELLALYPSLTVVASAKALAMMPQFFPGLSVEGRSMAVKEGDVLSLGEHSLQFFAAPFVHWPEVMVSFDAANGVLYSADGFGKFGALSRCGFYGREDEDWTCEARRYYFNIVGKYGAQVQALLKKASTLPIRSIRPLHGPILEDNLGFYLGLYDTWSSYGVEQEGIFILYASIYGGTAEAAEKLAEILRAKGAPKVVVSDLLRSDYAENVEDAFRYSTLVVAAPSYDAALFPAMHAFLHKLQLKGWSRRRAAIIENGSWAPCAGRFMKEMLSQMKEVEIIEPMVTIKSRMKDSDLPALENLANELLK
ncbi:MAG: FprA family A-type flavoprotein [Bacteroidales bacterium]|nr:FprA family A-type flavoprotein [Bacteroidales bacterium]